MTHSSIRSSQARPQFLDLNGRRLFALQIEPIVACRGSMLYLPPFAEEMNRCRSHVAAQARAFAALGIRCLLLDPYGTGESEGHIADARWDMWLDDALAAGRWLEALGKHPIAVWGMRTGALLAADLAATGRIDLPHQLFWQPVTDGKQFITQYLRLRIASQMVNSAEQESTEQLRARLSAGEVIEVAGYPLTRSIADSLAARSLGKPAAVVPGRISWLEMVSAPDQPVSPAGRKVIDTFKTAGATVHSATVVSPLIWQLQSRADSPRLVDATLSLFAEGA